MMDDSLKIKRELRSVKIIIVEDDALTCTLMVDVLRAMEFKNIIVCRTAEDGMVEFMKQEFDLVITDWRLPGISGIEFTKKIREFEKGEKRFVPIIMVTGKALKEDVEKARDYGVTEYLVKPFSVKGMCAKIKSIMETPRKFVISEAYIGPDRRRFNDANKIPGGIDRRNKNG